MRSSPANASVICVPIEAISTSGRAIMPVNDTYMTSLPTVIVPARTARPPTSIMITPITPISTPESAVVPETAVIERATLRNSRCAPRANTSCSRRSAT